jgi:hypothetical protein
MMLWGLLVKRSQLSQGVASISFQSFTRSLSSSGCTSKTSAMLAQKTLCL